MVNRPSEDRPDETQVGPNDMPASSGGGLKMLLIPVALSIAGVIALNILGFMPGTISPTQLTNDMQLLRAEIGKSAAKASVDDMASRLASFESQVNTIKQDAEKAKRDITALQGDSTRLTTLSNDVTTLKNNPVPATINTQIKDLQDKVTTLTTSLTASEAKVADLTTRLDNLTNPATGGVVTGAATAELTTNGMFPTSFTTTDPTTATPFQIPLKLKITNGTNKAISNLQLYIAMTGYTSTGAVLNGTSALTSVTGGTTLWSNYSKVGNVYYYTNTNMASWAGTGLNLTANSTKSFTLIFTFTPTAGQVGTTIQFYPDIAQIGVSDYEVG